MIAWPAPDVPEVPGDGPRPRVHDSSTGEVRELTPGPVAGIYVCGITPYDATHMGHAATYVTFDLLGRALRDAGHEVTYVQNVTDVDEPLLERAERDGIDWQDLAERETALFREDMAALSVIPPDHYVSAVEGIPSDVKAISQLLASGAAYTLPAATSQEPRDGAAATSQDGPGGEDVYLDLARQPSFGSVSGWSREQMLEVFAERGGDPDRPGKRDPLDPLLWRAARTGEPRWNGGELGDGRPGWHIECTTIALDHLGMSFDVQGGGTDLVFPHHEMSAVQAVALTGEQPFAQVYVHQAMVGLDGEKMSKSLGNLVLVSTLRRQGVDPRAIRLALLARHYRTPWEWTDELLQEAQDRLRTWTAAAARTDAAPAEPVVQALRERLADDLDSPGALTAVDAWARETLGRPEPAAAAMATPAAAASAVARAVEALLGVRLRPTPESESGPASEPAASETAVTSG
ncbi:MAG TPA: cysteine--1-D-myo-inosityl 2-amino-2-deoxy-alpha-D-glucopyranoside ligase [Segeticoccus sp.]|uniref:cysteine--1-D-myo-inosityl 2-amino-2-deoxy-alpha-D-glucopyranoside ligase n=1 Tax=Segeticoccus sp. TaxID=2706531 RepID=UPI002D7E9269|nr:cysteine--1-D-myo-inosityl 2-amino-2-deoxy-alpha-D-glucopyranoside ligase [Segeticoccus sp.]HET8598733.1 cysteine--1-D-myo-inosityl 2-amino-2-deoxy-alpha-D-glucopyranoside ligase [Segeticoccus sp.]